MGLPNWIDRAFCFGSPEKWHQRNLASHSGEVPHRIYHFGRFAGLVTAIIEKNGVLGVKYSSMCSAKSIKLTWRRDYGGF